METIAEWERCLKNLPISWTCCWACSTIWAKALASKSPDRMLTWRRMLPCSIIIIIIIIMSASICMSALGDSGGSLLHVHLLGHHGHREGAADEVDKTASPNLHGEWFG